MATHQRGYLEIKEMILLGEIPMGARIVELRLAEQLGISRTPVREALRRLTSDRLVEFHPNRGYQAVSYSAEDVASIYSCRALLESEAVRLAAECGLDDVAATRLRDVDARADTLFASNPPNEELRSRFLQLNNEFHSTLYGACPNPILQRLIKTTTDIPIGIRNYFRFSDQQVEASHTAHKNILRAVLNGQPERAGALMREHIWTAKDQMIDRGADAASENREDLDTALSLMPKLDQEPEKAPAYLTPNSEQQKGDRP